VVQKWGRQGQADNILYALKAQYPAAFHDVTVGTNSMPCEFAPTVTPNCISAGAGAIVYDGITEGKIGTGATPEYNAAAGYNLATGLGTIDAANLVNNWASVKFAATATTMTPSSTSFAHGTPITISGAVTGTGTPTGNVALMTDSSEPVQQGQGLAQTLNGFVGTYGSSTFALSSGSYSGSVSTLPGGTYHIWGQYGGDSKNAMSTSAPPVAIDVTPENSGIFFNAFSPSGTIAAGTPPSTAIDYGTQMDLSAQVAPSSQLSSFSTCTTSCPIFTIPTGTVAFADNSSTINTAVVNAEGDAEYNAPFAVGSHSVTANYSGDNSYNKSTSSAISFTVAKDTPDLSLYTTLTTTQNDLISGTGQQTILTVEISNNAQSSFASSSSTYPTPVAPPTGTVTLSGSTLSALSGSVALSPFVDPTTAAQSGVANFVVPANTATGTYQVTIAYSGDGNYNSIPASSNTTASIPITNVNTDGELASATTATANGSISPNTTITVTGTVTGSGTKAPTGGVYVFSSGAYLEEVGFSSSSGDVSPFTFALSSQYLVQGSNYITLQYSGDSVYNPSTFVLYSNTPVSSPLSDFTLVPDTTIVPVSISAGASSGTDTINVSSVNGFNGAVNLTCAATTPLTCTISPNPSVSTGNPSTATLTIKVPAATANGNYNVLVTGKDAATGEFIHTLAITADVSGEVSTPTFALSNSGNITVVQGATTGNTSTITVTPSDSFTGVVNLTCAVTTAPAGAANPLTCTTADLNPDSVNITGAGALTSVLSAVTTATTTPGSYAITVTGTSGALTSTTVVNVTVNLPQDFALTNSGAIVVSAGVNTGNTSTITVTPSGGFSSTVNLTCAVTTVPPGAANPLTCGASNLNPDSVTPPGTTTSVLTASTTATSTTGAYVIMVTGAFGTDTHTTTVNVTVNPAAAATYTVSATSPSSGISPGSNATSTITAQGSGGYTGSVTLSCSLTSSPSGASDLPGCSITTGSPVALSAGTTSGQATATVTTTAASSSNLAYPKVGNGKGWLGAGSGAVLAVLIFFGIPARRRSWRSLLGIVVAMLVLGGLSSCGGSSGGGGGGGGGGNPGTTAGPYTFTVTSSGNPAVTPAPATTFTVSVN